MKIKKELIAIMLEKDTFVESYEYEVKTLDDEEPEIVEEAKDDFDQIVGKAFAKFMASKLGGLD